MNFCSDCAAPVTLRVPPGEDRDRYVCDACGVIHYQNPKVVAGALPVYGEQVLLCRRAIAPRRGYWTLPAGYLENGETTGEGAARETREEACAEIEIEQLYCYVDIPRINQLYVMFLARLPEPVFAAGTESLEVALFDEADIPWDELAFPSMKITLERFFADRKSGRFPTHRIELSKDSPALGR